MAWSQQLVSREAAVTAVASLPWTDSVRAAVERIRALHAIPCVDSIAAEPGGKPYRVDLADGSAVEVRFTASSGPYLTIIAEKAQPEKQPADEDEGGTCTVCGCGTRWGSRHFRCGSALIEAERAAYERGKRDAGAPQGQEGGGELVRLLSIFDAVEESRLPNSLSHMRSRWRRAGRPGQGDDYRHPAGTPCERCSRPIEEARRCYVHPICYGCIPPPEPLPQEQGQSVGDFRRRSRNGPRVQRTQDGAMTKDSTTERRAPVQGERGPHDLRFPAGTIAWSEHEEVWALYAEEFGREQDADRIAERGGFSAFEAMYLLKRPLRTWEPR